MASLRTLEMAWLLAVADDLADLRAGYPDWQFAAGWVAVGSGPDGRTGVPRRSA